MPPARWRTALIACTAAIACCGCTVLSRGSMPKAVEDPSSREGGTCNDVAARFLLGKTVDERIAEDARVRSGARLVRLLRPGVGHDDEQRPSRLSIEADELGRAVAVRCG